MAKEVAGGIPRSGSFVRRLRDRMAVWQRAFLKSWNLFKASRIGVVGLAIMVAFVILALAAPFMGLRDPIGWRAPDEDVIAPQPFWQTDSSQASTDFFGAPPITQPVAFRVVPESFEPPTDRLYVAAENRLYAISAGENEQGKNAWGTPRYFNVRDPTNLFRRISAQPLPMNFGDYSLDVPDYELYLGTDDGTLVIIRDVGDTVPFGDEFVHRIPLDGRITGVAAYNGDMAASIKPGTLPVIPAIRGSALYEHYEGQSWISESVDSSGDDGQFASLALDSSGKPHLAYYTMWAGLPKVLVRGGGGWRVFNTTATLEPSSNTVNVGLYTSLAIGSDDRPRIAYYDEKDTSLKFASWNGTGWNVSFVEDVDDVGRFASLALNAADAPRIAYLYSSGAAQELHVATLNGAMWDVDAVDQGSVGQYASLALDGAGDAHVAYYDEAAGSLKYARELGGVWLPPETVDQGNDTGRYASLAVDATTGQPHIAYYDATAGALMYATNSTGWVRVLVDDAADVGLYASIALNATGPAIAYHDATDLDLKYAWLEGGAWNVSTLRSTGHSGLYNSLRFDAAGRPRIAHYSFVAGRTAKDLVVVGTETGKLYAIDVGIPRVIKRVPQAVPREQVVDQWWYRVRWVADLGAEVHLAASPLNTRTSVPLFSPAFLEDGSVVYAGTADGRMVANYTSNGTAYWDRGSVFVGNPWSTAPVAQNTSEGPMTGRWVVYAGSNHGDVDGGGPAPKATLLFARDATSGDPLTEWEADRPEWAPFDWGAPVEPPGTGASDGGNLTQPTVEGPVVFVGSTSGRLYSIRRDAVGGVLPGSVEWMYRDEDLIESGIQAQFTSPAVVVGAKGVLVVSANHDAGTPAPADDRGVLYSIKLKGFLSWRQPLPAVSSGQPASWKPKGLSLDENVWIAFGSPSITGVAAFRTTGIFLAPSPPSWIRPYPSGNQYWLGLDNQGRDIFSQLIWGSRIALLVGFLTAFFSVVLGVVVGLVAGYVGGKVEVVLMRFTDVILVLPTLPLIITLAAVLGTSIWNIILVLSLLGWPGIARIVRAEVLSLKERPFIDSARVTGASTTRIVFRHIAPNVMPLAFLYMTFAVSGAILAEASLSFIGLGDISTMSWGIMLFYVSQSQALTSWWWLLPPGLAITLISLAFFLVGRAFDEIVNPRLRKR